MPSIQLYERTVTVGGEEYEDGGVRIKVLPRTFRIREYETSEIELLIILSFLSGFMVWPALGFVVWLFT